MRRNGYRNYGQKPTLHLALRTAIRVEADCQGGNVPVTAGPSYRENNGQSKTNVKGRLGVKVKTNRARAAKQHEMAGYLKTL